MVQLSEKNSGGKNPAHWWWPHSRRLPEPSWLGIGGEENLRKAMKAQSMGGQITSNQE